MKCIYCDEEIITTSKEHIIHNALGGTLKSTFICCAKCNNFLCKQDSEFTKIFYPIIMHLSDFRKEENRNSVLTIDAEIEFNQKIYAAKIRNKKISSIPELQKEKQQDIKNFTSIDNYKFELFKIADNETFKNGFRKIAFNYAVEIFRRKNIPTDILMEKIKITKNDNNKIKIIDFKQKVLPFYAATYFEYIIDLNDDEIFHNLILFTDDEKNLWCYIGLFNTFKYYVLLAENCNSIISEEYCQKISQIDHNISCIYFKSPKDKIILAEEYDIDVSLDNKIFTEQIKEKIMKKNNVFDYYEYMNNVINDIVFFSKWTKSFPMLLHYYQKGYFYYTKSDNNTDEERYIDSEKYKKKILWNDKEISYPVFLNTNFDERKCKKFCSAQLMKLSNHIITMGNKR